MSIITDLIAPGGGVADLISTVIKRVWPDKAAQQQAQQQFDLQLLQMQQRGELDQFDGQVKLALAQVQTNNTEAANRNFFVSGARPAVMWVCTAGLAYQILARPMLMWASIGWWHIPIPPAIDNNTLMTLLVGLLGLGTMHVTENVMQGRQGAGNG
jgi:hypothetical protein